MPPPSDNTWKVVQEILVGSLLQIWISMTACSTYVQFKMALMLTFAISENPKDSVLFLKCKGKTKHTFNAYIQGQINF